MAELISCFWLCARLTFSIALVLVSPSLLHAERDVTIGVHDTQGSGPGGDLLRVMNVNTFLLEVRIGKSKFTSGIAFGAKPDMTRRADGLVEWFKTLSPGEVPDVVVFNEIMSTAGASVIKRLCNKAWRRDGKGAFVNNILKCTEGLPFGFATRNANPAGVVKISSGVAILVRKGLSMSNFAEEEYKNSTASDAWSRKGFMSVNISGLSMGDFYIVGTHTQAWAENANTRVSQFHQMWKHIAAEIPQGSAVVLAGDFNVENGEIAKMKSVLNAVNPPVNETGFWLPLRVPVRFSTFAGGGQNAYLHFDSDEWHAKSPHDQILYVSGAAGYLEPQSMRWQYVPMKSDACFETWIASKKKPIFVDDLSDHYAAYAELCFGTRCQGQELQGHRGFSGVGFGDSFECCRGRGEIGGKCFDWMPESGIKGDRIQLNGDQVCTMRTRRKTCQIADRQSGKGSPLKGAKLQDCFEKLAALDLPFHQLKCVGDDSATVLRAQD